MLDSPDLAVDELRRRARRRLVGAIVLALAAAVILPLLLESEPKPLGDEVSIQIPPIDSGKFVGSLSSPSSDPKRKVEPATNGAPAARRDLAEAEQRVLGPAAPAKSPPSIAPMPAQPEPKPVPETAAAAAQEPRADAKPAVKAEPQPASEAKAPPRPEPAKAAGDAFVVQLAAFADAKAASDLVAKLKSSGFPGYTEPLATSQGTMLRVRVGPYSSRDAADAALAKLKSAGYSGIVAQAK